MPIRPQGPFGMARSVSRPTTIKRPSRQSELLIPPQGGIRDQRLADLKSRSFTSIKSFLAQIRLNTLRWDDFASRPETQILHAIPQRLP